MIHVSSSDIVQFTLWLLIAFSVITWAIIISKTWALWSIGRANNNFGEAFWAAADFTAAGTLDLTESALGRIAASGFGVLKGSGTDASRALDLTGDIQSILERSLRQQVSKERKVLEQGLSMLASIGSTAPFVGLFGTVWGIMHALQDISHAKSASLDVVAGPIGEALIATAIGIAAAIPAVLAYNYFLRRIKLCEADLEYFATDFLNLVVRSGQKSNGG